MDYNRVNRNYHKYQAIRDYQDRGMVKWQGNYLSEHTSAMKAWRKDEDSAKEAVLSVSDKLAILSQSYVNQTVVRLLIKSQDGSEQSETQTFTGCISEMKGAEAVTFLRADGDFQRIKISEIQSILPESWPRFRISRIFISVTSHRKIFNAL